MWTLRSSEDLGSKALYTVPASPCPSPRTGEGVPSRLTNRLFGSEWAPVARMGSRVVVLRFKWVQ